MGSKSFNITSSAFVDTLLHKGQYYIILHYAVLHSTELFCTAQKLHCTVIHYTALLGVTHGGGGDILSKCQLFSSYCLGLTVS